MEITTFQKTSTVITVRKINAVIITAKRTPGDVVTSDATVTLDLPLKEQFLYYYIFHL
jgi:hypothetical protein